MIALATPAHAEFFTGNDLYNRLNDESYFIQGVGHGYVIGVFDVGQNALHCASNNVTAGQVKDLAKAYLRNNPEIRDKSADSILMSLFEKTWPCANRRKGTGV